MTLSKEGRALQTAHPVEDTFFESEPGRAGIVSRVARTSSRILAGPAQVARWVTELDLLQSPITRIRMNVPAPEEWPSSPAATDTLWMIGRTLTFPLEFVVIMLVALVIPSWVPGLMARLWPETIDRQSEVLERNHSEINLARDRKNLFASHEVER
jgi:hypothetical protein